MDKLSLMLDILGKLLGIVGSVLTTYILLLKRKDLIEKKRYPKGKYRK